jgi:hypothetical protein
MTDKNVGSIFLIDDGRLFIDSDACPTLSGF